MPAEDAERKRLVRSKKDASSEQKPSTAAGAKGKGKDSGTGNGEADDDEDMFGVGGWADEEGEEDQDEGDGGAGAPGDLFTLMGAPGPNRHRSKSAKVPGIKVSFILLTGHAFVVIRLSAFRLNSGVSVEKYVGRC